MGMKASFPFTNSFTASTCLGFAVGYRSLVNVASIAVSMSLSLQFAMLHVFNREACIQFNREACIQFNREACIQFNREACIQFNREACIQFNREACIQLNREACIQFNREACIQACMYVAQKMLRT